MDTVAGTALDMFVHHGLPWMGKKAVEMGRYYGSEALRDPKLQKKAIDYALDKMIPMIQNVGSQALDSLSTKIRPKEIIKQTEKILMDMLWISTRPLENYQNLGLDVPYQGIGIQVRMTIWKIKFGTIMILVKY